jgi:signal transduction histidine kinase
MTQRVGRTLAASALYVASFVVATTLLPPPASAPAQAGLGHLYLLLPALAALVATTRAARAALGTERAFWSLLAGAAAAQMAAETAFLLHGITPGRPALLALGHTGHYTFSVLVAVSVFVCPHRPLGAGRLRAAIVEWTMIAVVASFLVFRFLAAPLGEGSSSWFWIFAVQQCALAAGFAILAGTVRSPPFAIPYRILAAGLTLSAAAGILPNWRQTGGHYAAYSVANLDSVLALLALAAAAAAERGRAWMPGREDAETSWRRGWVMPAAVMLPLVVDVVARLVHPYPAVLAEARFEVALAATGVLLALTAIRVRGVSPARFGDADAPPSTAGSSEYVHFATGIAHELNNPLMAVGGWAELALRKSEPRESLEALLAATQRAAQSVRRLQQLGRAAEPALAAPVAGAPAAAGGVLGGRGWTRWLVGGTALFAAAYFTVFRLNAPPWTGNALLVLPPTVAALVLWRRGRRARTARAASFWRLVAASAAAWAVAEGWWVLLEIGGGRPYEGHGGRLLSVLFLGFLIPILVALGLRAHPPIMRKDPAAVADSLLIAAAVLYAFVHLVMLSAVGMSEPSATQRILLAALPATITIWAAVLWRAVDHPTWRRAYGSVAVFALSYGTLRVFASGVDGHRPPPGGWADLAWFLPFAFLIGAVGGGRGVAVQAFPALLAAGAGPIVLDLLSRHMRPSVDFAGGAVSTVCALLLAAAAALRLYWQVEVDRRVRREARLLADESQRAGRLTALASLVAAAVGELEDQLEEVSRRARAASVIMPDKGEQMLQQARHARNIVRELTHAFRLVPPGPRRDIDLAALLEEVVEGALEEGLPLHVGLEEVAGLPAVHGDPCALSAALSHLLRNAAQASPGGVLRIRGAQREGEVELRFIDDGPGVPTALRGQIFDPFFTTRRVGDGVGLGLTLVHFVARGHGGSIVLEDTQAGACFALRLPTAASSPEAAPPGSWPFATAALVSGAMAAVMAAEPGPPRREALSVVFQIAAAVTAAVAMAWASRRQGGSRRAFWAWLAAGAGLWALTRTLRVMEGGLAGRPSTGMWPLVLYGAADLSWAAALLLRPDRRHDRPSSRLGLSAGAALVLFAYAQAHLVVLPDPFSLRDPALRNQLVLVRGLLKLALPLWAAVLAWRALTPYWKRFYGRLSAVLAAWAVGQALAFAQRSRPGYAAGGASDLGWIVPFLALAAFALYEAARPASAEEPPRIADRLRPAGSAHWLVALAVLVGADALFGASGYPALDAARARLTQTMVVVMTLILAAREIVMAREGRRPWRGRFPGDAGPSRWVRLVGSAIHELGSHLSSITALARLLLSQSDASPRLRADTLRLHERAEAATRVVRNILAALPSSVGSRERHSVNRVVEEAVEARRPALERDGIVVSCTLGGEVPEIALDAPALRHVLAALLDRAAVAIRAGAPTGQIDVATTVRGGAVLVTVGDSGLAAPGAVLDRLMDALADSPEPHVDSDLQRSVMRESVERQGGSLAVGHRPGGGTEFVVRLPFPTAYAPSAQGTTPMARSG